MFGMFFTKKKVDPNAPPPGKIAAVIKSSRARIDSQMFHLYQWDGFGFILKPSRGGDLIATQIFYPKITIELETDSIVIAATAEVLTVGETLAAKWITMSGAEARWLKRYMLRHGPGYNPNTQEPTAAEPEEKAEGQGKPGEPKPAEKPGKPAEKPKK